MPTLGDFAAATVIYGKFSTYRPSTGATFTLGGSPVLSVYKTNSTTQSTAGVTLTADFDGVTGLNHFTVDTSADGTFYSAGGFFDIVITTGTVDSVSVVGSVVASFTLRATSLSAAAMDTLVDLVWDEVLTGAAHNVTSSSGKRLREITNTVTHSGVAQAGGTATITLASTASTTDGIYDPSVVRISAGTGAGQARLIIQYTGSTRVAAVDRDWRVTPDTSSEYEIISTQNIISTNEGIAQGGGTNTITLNALASSTTDAYVGQLVVLRTGTGQDQARIIGAYNGTTKVATVNQSWLTNPVAGTGYIMWPLGRALVTSIIDDAITAASFASSAGAEIGAAVRAALGTELDRIDAPISDVPTATENADALLNRDMGAVSDTNSRSPLNGLRFLRNGFSISGTTLTVLREDDTTPAYTRDLTTDAAADPITGVS